MLEFVSIPSSAPASLLHHTSTLIFMHGLGDSGHGWASVAKALSKRLPHTRFILPHAPLKRVSLNGGASMPAWYDLLGLHESAPQDAVGIFSSAEAVLRIVEAEEKRGVSRDKIVLGGFSQGGAIALVTGLLANRKQKPFAGILALSAYVPIHSQFEAAKADPDSAQLVSETPVFMGHGTSDMVVSYRWAQQSASFLKELGCGSLLFKTYKHMEHSVCDEELEDAAKFLRKTLKYEEDASRSVEL